MTIRQIDRLWKANSFTRLSQELLAARPEASFIIEGLDRPCAVAAVAIIRMDELSQTHVPLYSQMIRTVLASQDRDGGWGDAASTALCVRALMLGKGEGLAIERGLTYLAALQKEAGIWPGGPLRRMPEDPAVSLFVLYQLGDNARFRAAVRFDEAIRWFSENEPRLDATCRTLFKRAGLRCRSSAGPTPPPRLVAAA